MRDIQRLNEQGVIELNFPQNPANFLAGLFAESGEVADIVARLERWKKVKSTDINVDEILKNELKAEIADVLVYLMQIATYYGIDAYTALESKWELIRGRTFHN